MKKEEFEAWVKTLSPAARAQAEGFFTVIRRGPDRRLRPFRIPRHTNRIWKPARICCARRPVDFECHSEALPRSARGGVSFERLLRKRRGVDGSRFAARYHDRPIRDLQRRTVRIQGGIRGLCQHSRRSRDRKAEVFRRSHAGSGEQSSDRAAVSAIRRSARFRRSRS